MTVSNSMVKRTVESVGMVKHAIFYQSRSWVMDEEHELMKQVFCLDADQTRSEQCFRYAGAF